MQCPDGILDAGFCWFHLRALMAEHREEYLQSFHNHRERFLALDVFLKQSYRNLLDKHKLVVAGSRAEPMFAYFFMTCKKMIPWKELERI